MNFCAFSTHVFSQKAQCSFLEGTTFFLNFFGFAVCRWIHRSRRLNLLCSVLKNTNFFCPSSAYRWVSSSSPPTRFQYFRFETLCTFHLFFCHSQRSLKDAFYLFLLIIFWIFWWDLKKLLIWVFVFSPSRLLFPDWHFRFEGLRRDILLRISSYFSFHDWWRQVSFWTVLRFFSRIGIEIFEGVLLWGPRLWC